MLCKFAEQDWNMPFNVNIPLDKGSNKKKGKIQ